MKHSSVEWWRPITAYSHPGIPASASPEPAGRTGLSFWALMAFTFILLLAPQDRFPVLAPLRTAMLSAAVAIAAHVLNRMSRGLPIVSFTPAVVYALILVGWAFITAPFSYWPGGSIAFLANDYLKTVITFLLIANVIDSLLALKRIVWALVLLAIPLAVQTLSNFSSGDFTETGGRVAGYAAGLTSNPNDLALMLNLILPLCIALFLAAKSAKSKIILGSIACLLAMTVIVTFSRAGFLTLVVIGLCYFWRLRKRPQRVWLPVGLVLALMALPFIPSNYVDRISTIVNIEKDPTQSAQTRLADMKAALRLSGKHVLVGSGIGMSALAMNEERGETWLEVHNVYLQLLVELGLPGLLLFMLLFRYCFHVTGKILRDNPIGYSDDLLFYITEGIRVSLIAFAFGAFFHPVAYSFYFYYFAGLALAAGAIHTRAQNLAQESSINHGVGGAIEADGSIFHSTEGARP